METDRQMTVLDALRAATRATHDGLSAALSPDELCADRARYTAFLGALYGFHLAAERALVRAAPVIAPSGIVRSQLIADDLAFLGADVDATSVMPWSVPLDEPGAAWGVVYVVEGSALGGALLAKLARRHLALGPDAGAAFFNHGAGASGRWRAVKAELSAPADSPWAPAATDAAADTFDALGRWMAGCGLTSL